MRRVAETGQDCRGQLLLRARRGLITEDERIILAAHLSTCDACQQLNEFGQDFEALGAASPADSAVLARISQRALRGIRAPRAHSLRLSRGRVAWLAAASVALLAGLAGATLLKRSVGKAPSASLPHGGAARATDSTLARLSRALPSEVPPSSVPLTVPGASAPPLGSARTVRLMNRAHDTAVSLFREANEARRAGDATRASLLYRELQRRFPAAPETRISRVSLGTLLIESGASAPALQQFENYLAGAAGPLAAEAMYGSGRALKNLRRVSEERATWQDLLTRFPRSPYASYATRRLAELN